MADHVHTFGLGVRGRSGKLELTADATTSRATSTNTVTGGNWANNPLALTGAPAGTIAAYFIPAAPLPAVTANTSEIRLNAFYTLSKRQTLRVLYSFLRTTSADWNYEGMQMGAGTPSGVLPTGEQPFGASVHVFGVAYLIKF